MSRTMVRIGDRMLGRLLRQAHAGACVPEQGQQCAGCVKYSASCYCDSNGVNKCQYRRKSFNCSGSCANWSSYCYSGGYLSAGFC